MQTEQQAAAKALENFKSCADNAPAGTYEEAKALNACIGDACDNLMASLRALGLKADACDLIFAVEVALYQYAKRSNPDATVFPVSEGFGSAMDGPARERVLRQAGENLETLRALGIIQ